MAKECRPSAQLVAHKTGRRCGVRIWVNGEEHTSKSLDSALIHDGMTVEEIADCRFMIVALKFCLPTSEIILHTLHGPSRISNPSPDSRLTTYDSLPEGHSPHEFQILPLLFKHHVLAQETGYKALGIFRRSWPIRSLSSRKSYSSWIPNQKSGELPKY